MNPELKAYLDELSARDAIHQRAFDEKMARISEGLALLNGGFNTTPVDHATAGGVTRPVMASSDTTELVTVSVRPAAHPAPITTIQESPAITHAGPISIIVVASVTCSTECPSCDDTEPAHASTPAVAPTSPTATVDAILVLAATASSDGTLDGALTPVAPLTVSSAPDIGVGIANITKCMVHTNCDDPGQDQRPPWPPPSLVLAYVLSELQHDKGNSQGSVDPPSKMLWVLQLAIHKEDDATSKLAIPRSPLPVQPSRLSHGLGQDDQHLNPELQVANIANALFSDERYYIDHDLDIDDFLHGSNPDGINNLQGIGQLEYQQFNLPLGLQFLRISINTVWKRNRSVVYTLLILFQSAALRCPVLWSSTTAVLTEIVNMFHTHHSAAVMIELVSAVAANHSWDVPLLFSMYPSIRFGTVQNLFSAHVSDVAFRLHQAHFPDTCTHTGELWKALIISSDSRFRPHKCIHGNSTTKSLVESIACPDYVPSFLQTYLLQKEARRAPCLGEVLLGAIPSGPNYFLWNIAWVLVESSCAHIKLEMLNSPDLAEATIAYSVPHCVHLHGEEEIKYVQLMFKSLFLDTTSEEVFQWLSDDNHPAVHHLDDSVPCCVDQYIFALFRCEIVGQPRVDGECFAIGVHYFQCNIFEGCPSAGHIDHMQASDSAAGHIDHIMLQSDGAENYQLLTQPGEYLSLCLQSKPPWLSVLTKNDTELEEGVMHPHGEERAFVQLMLFKQLLQRPYSELPEICSHKLHLIRRGMEAGLHSSCESTSRPLLQAPGIPHNNTKTEASRFRPVVVLELQGQTYRLFSAGTRQTCMVQSYSKFSDPDHFQKGIFFKVGHLSSPVVQYAIHGVSHSGGVAFYSGVPMCTGMRKQKAKGNQAVTALFFWVPTDLDSEANQHWNIPWDPRGYMFAICNSHNWWITPELNHLHCLEELQWYCALASRIWLVTWDVDNLEFSTGCGQTSSQGGRNVTDPGVFFDQVHDYYGYYLDQAYFDTICCDIICYHKYFHTDSTKNKEVHMRWDPGKLVLCYHLKFRLGDKPNFKEGGMLGTYPILPILVLGLASSATTWAWALRRPQEKHTTNTWEET